jgi:hypothetical protein
MTDNPTPGFSLDLTRRILAQDLAVAATFHWDADQLREEMAGLYAETRAAVLDYSYEVMRAIDVTDPGTLSRVRADREEFNRMNPDAPSPFVYKINTVDPVTGQWSLTSVEDPTTHLRLTYHDAGAEIRFPILQPITQSREPESRRRSLIKLLLPPSEFWQQQDPTESGPGSVGL